MHRRFVIIATLLLWLSGTSTALADSPLAIVARAPADSSPNAALATVVTVRLSQPIDPASLTTTSFRLGDAAGTVVPATVAYDDPNRTATLTPTAPLHPGAVYGVTVEGLLGIDATPLATQAWPFTTVRQLVGAGDIAVCGKGGEPTAQLLDGIEGDVFTLGDNAYPNGTSTDFANCYSPTWGRHLARTHPASGNHDYTTPGATGYYQYFGAAAGDPALGYYSYEEGSWHVVVLNSNCTFVACADGSAQAQWLRADLAAHPSQCSLAMWHHPRFGSGGAGRNDSVEPLFRAFYEAGGDLILNGHEHDYERFVPMDSAGTADPLYGVRTLIVGTGGDGLNRARRLTAVGSELWQTGVFGVLKLSLRSDAYDWQFVPVAGQTFADAGTSNCHGAPGTPPTAQLWSDPLNKLSLWKGIVRAGGRARSQDQIAVSKRAVLLTTTRRGSSRATLTRKIDPVLTDVTFAAEVAVTTADERPGHTLNLLSLRDQAGNSALSIRRDGPDSALRLVGGGVSTALGNLPLGEFATIEIHLSLNPAGTPVEVRVNGLIVARVTLAIPAATIAAVKLGNDGRAQKAAIAIDSPTVRVGPLP